jgi:lysophospholipase L1-like esterase
LVQFELEIDSIQYIARTGWTTDELNAAIDEAKIEGTTYDWVTFSIGVNNQYRGRDTANYRIELKGLIDRVLQFSGQRPERVWVPSIPDWGVTPFAQRQGRDPQQVAQEIDAYNQILRQEAEKAGFIYADITEHSRTYGSKAAFLASDGLHPGPEMYSYWVKALLEAWKTSQTPL